MKYHNVPISAVIIPEDRQRKAETEVHSLMDSIRRVGLINPIVVTREHVLVAGFRRMTAYQKMGNSTIPAQYTDEADPVVLQTIELEENLRRVDLTWQEECEALSKIREMRLSFAPEETVDDCAEAIGMTRERMGKYLMVNSQLENENIKKAPNITAAYNLIKRAHERAIATEIQAVADVEAAPTEKVEEEIKGSTHIELINKSFIDYTQSAGKFSLIHTDFPYGIGHDTSEQGGSDAWDTYEDDEEIWDRLLRHLILVWDEITFRDAHLIMWMSMNKWRETTDLLELQGFNINPMPFVWYKSNNRGILPDPRRGPRQVYETALLASKGDPQIVKPISNCVAAPQPVERDHISQKPLPVVRYLLSMYVDDTTNMLDPTCGSGTALIAAEELGASRILGIEQSETFAELARDLANQEWRKRQWTANKSSKQQPSSQPETESPSTETPSVSIDALEL